VTVESDKRLSMLEHLEELRWRVFKAAAVVVAGAIAAYVFRNPIFEWLKAPFEEAFPGLELQTIKPTEQFASAMRIAAFGGFVLASPFVSWQLWAFVAPGLTKKERRWTIPIVAAMVVLFLAGVAFAYLVLPRGLLFLNSVLDVPVSPTVSEYLSFVLRFLLVFGLAFEYPVFMFAAGAVGLVSSKQLGQARRWAILTITVVAAAATPTGDPFTMLVLAVPLYLMYEITLLLIRFVLRK